jgi:hypothetical protein
LVFLLVIEGGAFDSTLQLLHWDASPLEPLVQRIARASNASRIFTIDPSCAGPGDEVTITGNGFGALNVVIQVGGVPAQLVTAYGNRATFIVPVGAPVGVTTVTATNPGGHTGSIAFRVKTGEICGNQIDEDCDAVIDDPDVCAPVNHPPVAHAGADQTAPVGTTVHLDGATSSDPDGNLLIYQWTVVSRPAASTAALTNATSATPSFVIDQPGNYTFQLTVNDGALSDSDTVIVSTSNSAPVANAGPDQTGFVTGVVTLDGTASSDVDGDALSYHWSLLAQPPGSTTAPLNATTATPSLTLDAAGEYVVQLIVQDGALSSAPDTMTISTLNSPPVAAAGSDRSGQVGETVILDGAQSSDVDGDTLTYTWSVVTKPAASTATLLNAATPTPRLTLDKAGT